MTTPRNNRAVSIPAAVEPRFWDDVDGRTVAVREIRQRIETLQKHTACDSIQKELLIQRAVFISVQLETAEINAAEGKPFEAGIYTQMCNCLSGLLAKLGLDRKTVAKSKDLEAHLQERGYR